MEVVNILGILLSISLSPVFGQFCDECGCFSNDAPFNDRPMPEDWQTQQLNFILFTPSNPSNGVAISWNDIPDVYDPSRPTIYLIHGWNSSPNPSLMDIKDAFFDAGFNYNVIMVDWSVGSQKVNYAFAASNTRVVGACTAHLADVISGGKVEYHHCIGNSLGGQTCGYMGKTLIDRNQLLGRITGLDPAGPLFNTDDIRVRMDKSDTFFMDNIHTNAQVLGLGRSIGHVDFYPNKGMSQPPCEIENPPIPANCNHGIGRQYFASSIRNNEECSFHANPCSSVEDADNGLCETCEPGIDCQRMGYYAAAMIGTGSFYLRTTEQAPYCES